MQPEVIGLVGGFVVQIFVFAVGYGKIIQNQTDIREDVKEIKDRCNSLVQTNGNLFKHTSDNRARISRVEGRLGVEHEKE